MLTRTVKSCTIKNLLLPLLRHCYLPDERHRCATSSYFFLTDKNFISKDYINRQSEPRWRSGRSRTITSDDTSREPMKIESSRVITDFSRSSSQQTRGRKIYEGKIVLFGRTEFLSLGGRDNDDETRVD